MKTHSHIGQWQLEPRWWKVAAALSGPTSTPSDPLRVFAVTDPSLVRVVILGQDPYPAPGKANGLAFGIDPGWSGPRLTSSFGAIAEEVKAACGGLPALLPEWATLQGWAEQGVLLLNTRLTCEEGQPMSHAGRGWELLVHSLLRNLRRRDPVFVAWGGEARRAYRRAGIPDDLILHWSHPCKYSAKRGLEPFLGGGVFTAINDSLEYDGKEPIDWLRIGAYD